MEGRSEWGEPCKAVIEAIFSLPEIGMPVADVGGLSESTAAWVMLVGAYAWRYAGDSLGLQYAQQALEVAEQLGRRCPEILRTGDPEEWGGAIAWVVAERHRLLGGSGGRDPNVLADELGSTLPVLAEDANTVRVVLDL
jgi:hypothetical protein